MDHERSTRVESYLFAREVDAHGSLTDQVCGHLVLVAGNAGDDDVADGQALLETPAFHVGNVVLLLLQAATTAEVLHAGHVDGVDLCTIVGEESRKRTADDLAAVDDSDATAEETLAVVQERVVDSQVLEDLDAGQRSAGQNRLLQVVGRVEEADVLVHVADQLWRQAFDVLVHADGPLQGAVTILVEDGVVDDHTVDGIVGVGVAQLVLEFLAFHLTQSEVEAVIPACLAGPFGVHAGSRIFVRQEAMEVRFAVKSCQSRLDLCRQRFGDRRGQDDFTRAGRCWVGSGHGFGTGERTIRMRKRKEGPNSDKKC
jgi:hypothetical protein